MDFSNKTYRDHLILRSPEFFFLGGGVFGYSFLTVLDDLLYYGYKYKLKQFCLKEGSGGPPPENFY